MVEHALGDITGYRFRNADLLRQALTHRSFGVPHNERLEFLGDGVLNCVVAATLFEHFPQLPEGDLSRLRASLVNQQTLFEIAQHAGLGGQLRLGEGELKSGGAQRPSILADALEALIGAAFLDGGFAAAQAMVLHLFERQLREADPQTIGKDAKTLLQEFLQQGKHKLPAYRVVATKGAAHSQTFEVECVVEDMALSAQGSGSTRRIAEQNAAGKILKQIGR